MSAQDIVDVINFLNPKGDFTVEYIPEGQISNYEICFYHIIDNVNVSMIEINRLYGKSIPYNPMHKDLKIYLAVKKG